MGKITLCILFVIAFIVSITAVVKWSTSSDSYTPESIPSDSISLDTIKKVNNHSYAFNQIRPGMNQPVKEFTLIAIQTTHRINNNTVAHVLTFNGIVPGPEIRVNQGDFVRVKLINTFSEPVSIHWFGYPVVSAMDGVPGITQDPVASGETFTYEFEAKETGTYWYYSMINYSGESEERLYGALIVEPVRRKQINREYVLFIEEWEQKTGDSTANVITTINGRFPDLTSPLTANKGDHVLLRLINTGKQYHGFHVPYQIIKIAEIDGHEIENATEFSNQIINLGPGERCNVEFTVLCDENFIIDIHDENSYPSNSTILFKILDGNNLLKLEPPGFYQRFNLYEYDHGTDTLTSIPEFLSDSFEIDISSKKVQDVFQHFSNGTSVNKQKTIAVEKGNWIKGKITNSSLISHTFHIHGHWFKILAVNGRKYSSPIMKDVIYIHPSDTYTIAFQASNPGHWIMDCTIHNHDEKAYLGILTYKNYSSSYNQFKNGMR